MGRDLGEGIAAVEVPGLAGHLAVVDDRDQEVARTLIGGGHIAFVERLERLVGLLDQGASPRPTGGDIPGAGAGDPQAGHHSGQAARRVGRSCASEARLSRRAITQARPSVV